jgi:hypothetical protein
MFFINRGNSSLLLLAIVVLGFFFLINFLPYILLIGGLIWAINYGYKKIKQWKFNSVSKVRMEKDYTTKNKDDFNSVNNANVIDVEYTEVK